MPIEIFNDDIAGLTVLFNRFIEEAHKSTSSNITAVNEFDQKRFMSYIEQAEAYVTWVTNQPQLDLPETHPTKRELNDPPTYEENPAENGMVRDYMRMMSRARDELVNSQSARHATGLISYDKDRCMASLAKCKAYLTDYVAVVTPVDMPESTPWVTDTGEGRGGINP